MYLQNPVQGDSETTDMGSLKPALKSPSMLDSTKTESSVMNMKKAEASLTQEIPKTVKDSKGETSIGQKGKKGLADVTMNVSVDQAPVKQLEKEMKEPHVQPTGIAIQCC